MSLEVGLFNLLNTLPRDRFAPSVLYQGEKVRKIMRQLFGRSEKFILCLVFGVVLAEKLGRATRFTVRLADRIVCDFGGVFVWLGQTVAGSLITTIGFLLLSGRLLNQADQLGPHHMAFFYFGLVAVAITLVYALALVSNLLHPKHNCSVLDTQD